MKSWFPKVGWSLSVLFAVSVASAQILVEDPGSGAPAPAPTRRERPQVGEKAATDYFKQRSGSRRTAEAEGSSLAASDRVLGLHIGSFISDKAYRWGRKNKNEDPGEAMFGVTYRVGEWTRSMDLNLRVELMTYEIDGETPTKLSVMPIVSFPDARSEFPLYFGAGAGVGIFFQQAGDESDLSFDYALLVGARFQNVFDTVGLFFESGLKGHVHLLSSGQQDGVFLAGGAMFSF